MKKFLSLLAWIGIAVFCQAQAPGILNYQGVARNSVGNVLINKAITLRLTVHDGSTTGPVVYQESRAVVTNPFGLFNIQIGSPGATVVTGSVSGINWAVGNKYLQVEIDPAGGSAYINIGTVQLASVPYALNAAGAMPIGPAGGDLSGNYPNPTVAKIRGVNIAPTSPSLNHLLGFDGTNWLPTSLGSHPDNYWRKNGNDIHTINTGNVGIGINIPIANLHIKSDLRTNLMLQGTDNEITFLTNTGNLTGSIFSGSISSHDMHISQFGSGITFGTSTIPNLTTYRLRIAPEGNVGINTLSPHPSSKLDVSSTNSGLLMPRMTETQRNAITSPANGLMIYQTNNTPGFYFYDGTDWTKIATGGAVNNLWTANGNSIYNNNTGNVGIGTNTPGAALHVKSNILPLQLESSSPGIHFIYPNGNFLGSIGQGANLNNMDITSAGDMMFFTNTGLRMRIGSNGNVGIGLGGFPPNYKLHVESTGPGIVQTSSGRAFGMSSTAPTGQATMVGGFFGTFTNDATGFFTNNLLRMTILQSGNVGIGNTNPTAKLHVAGNLFVNSDDEAIRLTGNDSYMSFYDGGSYKGFIGAYDNDIEIGTPNTNSTGHIVNYIKGAPQFVIQSDGRSRFGPLGCSISIGFNQNKPKLSTFGSIGIKKDFDDMNGEWAIAYNTPPHIDVPANALKFYFNGGIKTWLEDSDGDWETLSDYRLKHNFRPYKSVLQGIRKIDVLTYNYKADQSNKLSFGLVAQNLQQYFPELVTSGNSKDGLLAISYAKTGVLAIKAIQEQQVMIDELKKENEEIKRQLNHLLQTLSNK